MSIAVKEVRKSNFFVSKKNSQILDEDDVVDLALAKSRINDEFTSGEEYRNFLKRLINESHSNKKGL